MGCSLLALIDGDARGSTLTGSRTVDTPSCPQCSAQAWVDPTSFTAYYRKLPSNAHLCVFGHEDPSVIHKRLDALGGPPSAPPKVLVIVSVSAGLCVQHLAEVRVAGIGGFYVSEDATR